MEENIGTKVMVKRKKARMVSEIILYMKDMDVFLSQAVEHFYYMTSYTKFKPIFFKSSTNTP